MSFGNPLAQGEVDVWQALTGRLKFTVQRRKFIQNSLTQGTGVESAGHFSAKDLAAVSQNPKPRTFSPKPYTLDPKAATLNPKPYTLNPKPYTLDPEA